MSSAVGIEEVADIGRRFACDIECEMRQQVLDEVGLMRAKLVAFAAAEERTLRASRRQTGLAFGLDRG